MAIPVDGSGSGSDLLLLEEVGSKRRRGSESEDPLEPAAKRVARAALVSTPANWDEEAGFSASETGGFPAAVGKVAQQTLGGTPPDLPPPSITLEELGERYQDLTAKANEGLFHDLVGRAKEVRVIERALVCAWPGASAMLVGDEGVGKRTVIQRLAVAMQEISLPLPVGGKHLIYADIPAFMRDRNWSDRLTQYIEDCFELRHKVICVLPNIDDLMRKQKKAGVLTKLGSLIDQGLQVIFTSSGKFDAGMLGLEKGRVTRIPIGECSLEDLRDRLINRFLHKEARLQVTVSREAILAAFSCAEEEAVMEDWGRGQTYDRAEEIIQLAIAEARIAFTNLTEEEKLEAAPIAYVDVDTVQLVTQGTEVAPAKTAAVAPPPGDAFSRDSLRGMAAEIGKQVLGQDHAIETVVRSLQVAGLNLRETGLSKPIASFLFLGTSGVGKTELAKALSRVTSYPLKAFDMTEFQTKESSARFIGSDPGYVGYEDGGQLTNYLMSVPNGQAIVLVDEIDKAHTDVLDIFMQIMDEGRVTDGQGRTVDCSNAVFIMTSNYAADVIAEGFERGESPEEVQKTVLPLLHEAGLRKEWIGRLDKAITFKPLSDEVFEFLIPLKLKKRLEVFTEQHQIHFSWDPEVCDWLREHGYSVDYGLRPLNQLMNEVLVHPVANAIIWDKVHTGQNDEIHFFVEDDKICFRVTGG